MKTIDFENKFYNEIYNYLTLIHGKQNILVNQEKNTIEVNLSNLKYFMIYSYNEDKIYFQNEDPEQIAILMEIDFKHYKSVKSFRVFRYEEAKKYIDFKKSESELIKNIEG